MTFSEYINQKDPERIPINSVELTKEDVYAKYDSHLNRTIGIYIHGIYYLYRLDEHNNCWTMDQDGNFCNRTVFKYLER